MLAFFDYSTFSLLALQELQHRFGDKPLKERVYDRDRCTLIFLRLLT